VSSGLSIECRRDDRRVLLVLVGELDFGNVGTLDAILADEASGMRGDVVLDLGALEFIGFAGLRVLVEHAHRLAVDGRRLMIAACSDGVTRAARIAGVQLLDHGSPEGWMVPTDEAARARAAQTPGVGTAVDILETRSCRDTMLVVRGELDMYTAPELRRLLDAAIRRGDVTLDLAGVDFVDSAALAVVERARLLAADLGSCVRIVNASDRVRRTAQLTGRGTNVL
jgi:anti-sigma B factor antagonist